MAWRRRAGCITAKAPSRPAGHLPQRTRRSQRIFPAAVSRLLRCRYCPRMGGWWLQMAVRKLTDKQWHRIRDHIPKRAPAPSGGRPWADDRRCLEGILWIMSTGAQWAELPRRYPSYSTCWRRLKLWEGAGAFVQMWRAFLAELSAKDQIVWDEAFADGTFVAAKKGGLKSVRRARARGRRS